VIYREQGACERYLGLGYSKVSKRQSRPGPFVIFSLGVSLALCIAYIVQTNSRAQSIHVASIERSLRILAPPVATVPSPPPRVVQLSPFHQPETAVTVVPQSRAGNAFLGGKGPALLREETRAAVVSVAGF
jgi:hypothetical protein